MPSCRYRSVRLRVARVLLFAGLCLAAARAASAAEIVVAADGDLQAALDAARPGDTIKLAPGATYIGNFVLPAKTGDAVITLRSGTDDALLPAEGTRIESAHAPLLAKLRSPNTRSALRTAAGAHHWRLLFLEFLANKDGIGTIISLGDGTSAQATLARVPYELTVDRCYIRGDAAKGQKRAIALNSASTAIVNSHIADIKAIGQDSQAILGWNGPGPYLIANNYLEAAGENVMFGGADPWIPDLVPSDIVVERNYLSKPLAWRGSAWSVKNLFELKNAQRVTIRRNLFEHNWLAAQPGYAILFTPRNQDGRAPWSRVQDVTFEHNVVRNVAAGVNILGYDNNHPSGQTRGIRIAHNVFTISRAQWGGSGAFVLIGDGPADIVIDHNTVDHDGNVMSVYGVGPWPIPGLVFTNNISRHNRYGIKGDALAAGSATLAAYFPGAYVARNVFAGGIAKSYPPDNWFPAASAFPSQFVDPTAGDYSLRSESPFRGAASDGLDVGAVMTGGDTTGPGRAGGPPAVPTATPTAEPPTIATDGSPAPTGGRQEYYLAEGATGAFFSLDVCLANPNTQAARVRIRFLTASGEVVSYDTTLPAQSRRTVHVNDIPGLAEAAVSSVVESLDGLPLLVDRSMFWNQTGYGGHTETAIGAPGTQWYFGEGSQGFFETYVLLANPGDMPATVDATFMRERGGPVVRRFSVGPRSRMTLSMSQIPELSGTAFSTRLASDVPVIAERAMYFGGRQFWDGGHESAGVPAPATSWLHAEGATGQFFDTFLLIGNPNATPAIVTVRYLLESGLAIERTHTIAPDSRITIDVEREDPRLADAAMSTTVTANVPVISERSMYWPGDATTWVEGHNSFGTTRTSTRWGMAEGRVGGPREFETYLLLANPSAAAATVRLTFLRTSGAPITRELTLRPTSRTNVHVNTTAPELANEAFGVLIESTNGVAIAVERTMYWNVDGRRWAGGTNAAAVPLD